MKIFPEKVSVLPNVEAAQLTVIMDGFRITLSRAECEILRDGLNQGLKHLDMPPDGRRPVLVGATGGETTESRRIGSD
jgi:hypothetical protein